MATKQTFSVSKKDFPDFEVAVLLPDSVDDPRWDEITSKGKEDIHDLALSAWIVKAQGSARNKLDKDQSDEANLASAQAAAESYKYGARTPSTSSVKPVLSKEKIKSLRFTKEQIASLAALGVRIEMDEPAAAGTQG